jgi:hypothetical protein
METYGRMKYVVERSAHNVEEYRREATGGQKEKS